MTHAHAAWNLVQATVKAHLENPARAAQWLSQYEALVPADQRTHIDAVLAETAVSYRDGLIIQLAFALSPPAGIDITQRPPGGRSVAANLGKLLREAHVPAVADAYQNIAKNNRALVRGNVPAFDAFRQWAARLDTSQDQLRASLEHIIGKTAATARPVTALPEINQARLTFGRVMRLFEFMFSTHSQGAHEQFIVAALLHAFVEAERTDRRRVETKKLNASDRSSAAAADVQIMTGSRVLDAFEVTANDWSTKLAGIEATIRAHDLTRVTVIAAVDWSQWQQLLEAVEGLAIDVSVVELRAFCATYVAILTKQGRATAIRRLYEFLDQYQPDNLRVNNLVDLLRRLDLTV